MTLPDDVWGSALIGAWMVGLLAVAERWARAGAPPELARKLVHVGGMVPCLLLPFVLRSPWAAGALAVALAALFSVGSRVFVSLGGVRRRGWGSGLYPLSVILLYLIARDRVWIYLAAVLTLGLADAVAAVVGGAYGRVRYVVEEETKSLEGSLVFLGVAFLAVHLPMLLLTDQPRDRCVLVALLCALQVTLYEAVSPRGIDNLFVPLGVYVILDRSEGLGPTELGARILLSLALVTLVVAVAARSNTFQVGGALVVALFCSMAWAFGRWTWILPPLAGFAIYVGIHLLFPPGPDYVTRVKAVVAAKAHFPALLLAVYADALDAREAFEGPFMACMAATAAFALWTYLRWRRVWRGRWRPAGALAVGALCAVAVLAAPWRLTQEAPEPLLAASAVVSLLTLLHELLLPGDRRPKADEFWTASPFLLSCAAAGAVALLQAQGIVPPWR